MPSRGVIVSAPLLLAGVGYWRPCTWRRLTSWSLAAGEALLALKAAVSNFGTSKLRTWKGEGECRQPRVCPSQGGCSACAACLSGGDRGSFLSTSPTVRHLWSHVAVKAIRRRGRRAMLVLVGVTCCTRTGRSTLAAADRHVWLLLAGTACSPKPWQHVECSDDGRVTAL